MYRRLSGKRLSKGDAVIFQRIKKKDSDLFSYSMQSKSIGPPRAAKWFLSGL